MNDSPSNPRSVTPDHVVSDTGPFSLLPEWVLASTVSDRAVRLYALLARYADQTGLSWPRRALLAERLSTSVKSVDRAMDELEKLQAVTIEARHDEGGQRSNFYRIRRACPYPWSLVTPPPGQPGPSPLVTGDAQNESQENETQGKEIIVSDDVRRLCSLLASLMVENGCREPTVTKSGWLDPMRLLIEKDGIEPDRVERAIRWSQADEFWRANIHSGKALREKYDTLRQQARRQKAGSVAQVADARAEYLARKQAG